MEFKTYEITKDRHFNQVEAESISTTWLTDDVHRWIDLTEFQQDELEELLAPLNLRQEVLDACLVPHSLPFVIILEHSLFLSIPVQSDIDNLIYLTVLCGPTILITIQHSDIIYLDEFASFYRKDRMLLAANTTGLLFELIHVPLKMLIPRFFSLRNEVVNMSQTLETKPDEVEIDDIMNLSQDASRIEIIFQDQRFCLSELESGRSETLSLTTIRGGLHQLIERIDRGLGTLARLQERIGDLHQFRLHSIEEATNRRLNMLAMLSAIYMPPTLIAAIFGMNFQNIPAIGWRYGYLAVMGCMITLVVGQLLYFRSRGWFK